MLTSTRLGRYILWNRPTTHDHLRFPCLALRPAEAPRTLPTAASPMQARPVNVHGPKGMVATALHPLLDRTGTTALIVLSSGRVAYEWYGNGGARQTIGRCFSVTKSFASALVGIAIGDGALPDIDTRVADVLPEFAASRSGELTLRHLLEMRSGIRFVAGPLPWSDDAICYYAPDCREAARRVPVVDPVGAFFHYNDYHLFLIGMILERATGEPLARYFERKLWQPMGAEYPASLSIDSRRHGFVHLESGLNAAALDLVRSEQFPTG